MRALTATSTFVLPSSTTFSGVTPFVTAPGATSSRNAVSFTPNAS